MICLSVSRQQIDSFRARMVEVDCPYAAPPAPAGTDLLRPALTFLVPQLLSSEPIVPALDGAEQIIMRVLALWDPHRLFPVPLAFVNARGR